MSKNNRETVEKFLNMCNTVMIYDCAFESVYVISVMDTEKFIKEFDIFNSKNGIQFVTLRIPNNKFVLSEW